MSLVFGLLGWDVLSLVVSFYFWYSLGSQNGVEDYRKTLYKLSEYRKGIAASRDAHKAFKGTLKALGRDNVGAAQVAYDTIADQFMETITPTSAKAFVHYHNRQKELREAKNASKTRTAD